jgi:hypothetical protein
MDKSKSQLWIFYNKLARQGARTDISPNGEKLPTWAKWLESKGIGINTPTRHFQALGWLPSDSLVSRLTGKVISQLWGFYNKLKVQGRRSDLSENSLKLPTWFEWIKAKGINHETAWTCGKIPISCQPGLNG